MSIGQFTADEGLSQALPAIAQRWLQYKPQIVLLSDAGFHNLGLLPRTISRVNDVALRGGGYEFPGVNGYVGFGSGSLVARDAHTMLAVCQLDSFPSAYPIVASFAAGTTSRITCFFSTDVSYSDFSYGGTGGEGTAKVSLTGSGPVLGTTRAIVVTRSGSTAAGHGFFVNGTKLTASTSASHANRTGNNILGQADTANLTFDFDGRIRLFALFDAVLPDALALELAANPAALFDDFANLAPFFIDADAGGAGTTINAGVGGAVADGHPASVVLTTSIAASVGAGVAAGHPATVALHTSIAAGVGDAAAAGHPAQLALHTTVAAGVGAAVAAGHPATIDVQSGTTINAGVGAAVAAGHPATINVYETTTINAGVGAATAAGHQATVAAHTVVAAGVAAATGAGHPAALALHTVIQASVGAAVAAGHPASITVTDPPVANGAAVWSYVLSNGKTAEQTVLEIHSMLSNLTPPAIADAVWSKVLP